MNTRSRSALVSPPITCWSVTHSVLTPRGIKYPQHKKTVGAFRPLERGGQHNSKSFQHTLVSPPELYVCGRIQNAFFLNRTTQYWYTLTGGENQALSES